MRRLSGVATSGLTLLLIILPLFLTSCARTPPGVTNTEVRELSFDIAFAGPINDNYYYYIPIDVNGGSDGPTPVFPDAQGSTGSEWVAGSATHFILYNQRQYTIYKITQLHPFAYEPIGNPIRSTVPTQGSNRLSFTIDLSLLGATGESIDMNVIALTQLIPTDRLLDGLGVHGGDFVNIDITQDRTFRNSETAVPEMQDDILDQNSVLHPADSRSSAIDIADWNVTVNI